MMIDTNYQIEALAYLLDKECLRERFYPLIPLKEELITKSRTLGYKTKNDLAKLSDPELSKLMISGEETVRLLRAFLKMYDPDPGKFREIEKLNTEEERRSFRELYYLPGVKQIRASLYFRSGYKSLKAVADANPEEILEKTAFAISAYHLPCAVLLPKEARTHVAVARAFTRVGEE